METRSVLPLVASVVVLSVLVRWLPLSEAESAADPLGRGLPWRHLELDADLLVAQAEREPLDRAILRPPSGKGAKRSRKLWLGWFEQVEELRGRDDPEAFAHFKGLLRNDQFLLTYDLFPVRGEGRWLEEGGSADEATLPGATPIVFRMTR